MRTNEYLVVLVFNGIGPVDGFSGLNELEGLDEGVVGILVLVDDKGTIFVKNNRSCLTHCVNLLGDE